MQLGGAKSQCHKGNDGVVLPVTDLFGGFIKNEKSPPSGSLDAENVCGLDGLFFGGASDLGLMYRYFKIMIDGV